MTSAVVVASLTLAFAGCGGGTASPAPKPAAATFGEFRTGYCSAWESIFLAVGNPDTGSGSELSDALDKAIADGNPVTVELAARQIRDELDTGRRHVAFAAGWEPAAAPMAKMDHLFLAFEAMVETSRAAASEGPVVARKKAQAAFEAAGAIEAWTAILTPESWTAVNAARPSGVPSRNCGDLPIGM